MAEEFVPPSTAADTKDCSGNTSGFAKKTDTQYIAYSITGDSDYPGEETCARHVHGDAQIDDLRVNNDLTVSGTINGTTTGNKVVAFFDIPHVKERGKRIRHMLLKDQKQVFTSGEDLKILILSLYQTIGMDWLIKNQLQ